MKPEFTIPNIGNDFFKKMLTNCRPEDREILLSVWKDNPFMIDAFVREKRDIIREWCRNMFGPEYIRHNDAQTNGMWRESNVTVMGYCWYGFSVESALIAFVETFPPLSAPAKQLFKVKGFCVVPHEVLMEVYATDEKDALAVAAQQWPPSCGVEQRGEIESAYDFIPREANLIGPAK